MDYQQYVGFIPGTGMKSFLEKEPTHAFHVHSDVFEFVCPLKGRLRLSDGAFDCRLGIGDVYIHNPNEPHRHLSSAGTILLTVQLDRDYYKRYFSDIEDSYFICTPAGSQKKNSNPLLYMRFLLAEIYFICNGRFRRPGEDPPDIAIIRLAYESFQYYMYKKNRQECYEIIKQPGDIDENDSYHKIYDAIDYVDSHYLDERLTLKALADKFYISEGHLSRSIHKLTGLTFRQHISLLRCEEAERLLCGTDKTMDEIAAQTGFANRSHLTDNFRKWYEKTPAKFRHDIKNFDSQEFRVSKMTESDLKEARAVLDGFLDQVYMPPTDRKP